MRAKTSKGVQSRTAENHCSFRLYSFQPISLKLQPNLRPISDPNNSRPNAAPKPNDSRHPPAGFPPARARPPTRSAQAWARTPGLRVFFSPPAIHAFHPTCWLVQYPLVVSSWSFTQSSTQASAMHQPTTLNHQLMHAWRSHPSHQCLAALCYIQPSPAPHQLTNQSLKTRQLVDFK